MNQPCFRVLLLVAMFLAVATTAFCDITGDYFTSGRAKALRGDFDGATADYTKAIQLNPSIAESYSHLFARKIARDPGALAQTPDTMPTLAAETASPAVAFTQLDMSLKERVQHAHDLYRAQGYYSIGNVLAATDGPEDAFFKILPDGIHKITLQGTEDRKVVNPDEVPQAVKDAFKVAIKENVQNPLVWMVNKAHAQEAVKAMQNKDQTEKVVEYNESYEKLLACVRVSLWVFTESSG
jgi:tetratricopeptide (TPR) repeat protein